LKNVQKVEEMKTEKNKIINAGKPKKHRLEIKKKTSRKNLPKKKKTPIGPGPEAETCGRSEKRHAHGWIIGSKASLQARHPFCH
jgi:hypothetical protein